MIELKDVKNSPDIKKVVQTKETRATKNQVRSMLEQEENFKHKEVTENRRKEKLFKAEKKGVRSFPTIGVIFLVLSMGLFYLAFITKTGIESEYHQQLKTLSNKKLNKLMGQASIGISNKTQSYITKLNSLKKIPFDSPAEFASLKKQLKSSLIDSLSIEIISVDYTDDEIIDDPKMGYTFLFLLNELKGIKNTADFTMIELYKGNTKDKKLLLFNKVMNNDVTIAYVIASLSVEFMNNLVTKFDAKDSYFEIIQQHDSTSFVLIKKGNASLKTLPIVISKNLKNTPWQFKYWSAEQKKGLAIEQYSQALMYLIFSIIAIFSAIILFILVSKKKHLLNPVVIVSKQQKKESQSFLNKLKKDNTEETTTGTEVSAKMLKAADNIFGAYDVLGLAGDFVNTETLRQIARLIAKELKDKKQNKIVIGRDGRSSSPQLIKSVINSVVDEGVDVINIGMVSTPMLYYAALHKADGNGLMITAGHNPANYNGMKIMLGGHHYAGSDLQSLKQNFLLGVGDDDKGEDKDNDSGHQSQVNVIDEYMDSLCENITLSRSMKIVIDAANGVMGPFSDELFKQLNCDVTILNGAVEGDFPTHLPDPGRPENMRDLAQKVVELKADIGFAFDGDGSRLGVVASDGQIIWPDRILMLLSKNVFSRKKVGTVLYDVKSSKNIRQFIQELGGKAIMCRCGHSFMANKLQEIDALIAGEMSGHIFVKDRWFGFDDAAYAAARVLEILSADERKSAPVFSELPQSINTPEILIETKDVAKIINKLSQDKKNFSDGEIIIIDGIRVEYEDGWGIVRASHTTNKLSIRFEAENEVALQRIANAFKASILHASPEISLPF